MIFTLIILLITTLLAFLTGLFKPKWALPLAAPSKRTRFRVFQLFTTAIASITIALLGLIFNWHISLLSFTLFAGVFFFLALVTGMIRPSLTKTLGKNSRKNIFLQYSAAFLITFVALISVANLLTEITEDDPNIVAGTYDGKYTDGLKQGHGKLSNQTISYKGNWEHGKRNGFGREVTDWGFLYIEYEGQWKNNKKHGKGKRVISFLWMDTKYEGEWKNGNREGNGHFVDRSGNIYEGEWVNDRPQGFGKMTLSNGETYTGEVLDFERHGYGKAVLADGEVQEGEWEEDEFMD
ncbi:hypothetical protein IMZ31_16940 [Pontibacillus sp. ALD_SL1]|uniref:MORN repeat-containing protein n=1 Tax=Pontibacillus sp. ALD_SL1 TaxID=2777185 RepID=UPI001A964B28|nr:hypothetical protein [Pontibacillus sp. ALD_SL1]QSS99728.1 hypothetical protein IMZ31_16940 [Pontibacillus sp. ALD_SL1]